MYNKNASILCINYGLIIHGTIIRKEGSTFALSLSHRQLIQASFYLTNTEKKDFKRSKAASISCFVYSCPWESGGGGGGAKYNNSK
jgi:hypothetical protein